jgi:hypothetical protein
MDHEPGMRSAPGHERLGLDDGDTPWIMAEIDRPGMGSWQVDRPGWGELA